MASDQDVPPLEDMSELIKQVESLRELKKSKPQRNVTEPSVPRQNGHGDTSAPKPTVQSHSKNPVAASGSGESSSQNGVKTISASSNTTAKASSETKKPSSDEFGGMKKGFLFGNPSKQKASSNKQSKQPKQTLEEIPFVTKNENAKSENFRFSEVQEAMAKTNERLMENKDWVTDDLLTKLEKNEKLAKRLQDPTFIQAIADFQKNPEEAVVKYGQNMEVQEFFKEFCGLMGDHFTKLEDKNAPATSNTTPPPTTAIRTNPAPVGADMSVRSSTDPKQATSQDEAKMQQILSDPEIRLILMDPQIQTLFEALRNNPTSATRVLQSATGELKGKINKLCQVGLLQFQS